MLIVTKVACSWLPWVSSVEKGHWMALCLHLQYIKYCHVLKTCSKFLYQNSGKSCSVKWTTSLLTRRRQNAFCFLHNFPDCADCRLVTPLPCSSVSSFLSSWHRNQKTHTYIYQLNSRFRAKNNLPSVSVGCKWVSSVILYGVHLYNVFS
jgi:hypothetical protein